MSIETADRRQYSNLVKRHTEKVQQLAARIAECGGYLVQEPTNDMWAQDIANMVGELRRRTAVLDALKELSNIFQPDA